MKKFTKLLALSTLALSFSALAAENESTLTIAATVTPHAEILEYVKPYLKERGVNLDIKVFTDWITPNKVLADGTVQANFYQHTPYLEHWNQQNGTNLVPGFPVFILPLGVYSSRYKTFDEVPQKATIAIPNDPTNGGRALQLLQEAGLIKLKDPSNLNADERDIAENPKKLKFRPVEGPNLARLYQDVDLDVITANFALKAGLVPVRDAIVYEQKGPYANIIATLPQNKDLKEIKLLEEAINRQEVKDWILQKFGGNVVPVFNPTK